MRSDKPGDDILSDAQALVEPKVEELSQGEFESIAIIGVGMVGGSIGLALRDFGFHGQRIGLDRRRVLDEALAIGAIDQAVGDLAEAVPRADLVILATPVLETKKLLSTVLRTARPGTVVTDTAGTKAEICALAAETKDARGLFIGGHPLTGTSRRSIANARAELFTNAHYILTPTEKTAEDPLESLKWWVRQLGGIPLVLKPAEHDRLMAAIQHLPLMLALALADGTGDMAHAFPLLCKLAQGDVREMTRLSDASYETWEGILQTNREEILKVSAQFRKTLKNCEAQLKRGDMTAGFQAAHAFRRQLLRNHAGLWDARCELIITAPDRPGIFARITSLLADREISIRDLRVVYMQEATGGTLSLLVASPAEAALALDLLKNEGFDARLRD
ncbi:prephenate dehydrogenase/arogenate dehydrogenase family protein [bacterium]|nr:prephenate dehydrogenase/arogenate dehydrogenase family protein [bacterium]